MCSCLKIGHYVTNEKNEMHAKDKLKRTRTARIKREILHDKGKAVRVTEGIIANQTYHSSLSVNSNTVAVRGNFSESVGTFAPGAIKIEAKVTASFLLN